MINLSLSRHNGRDWAVKQMTGREGEVEGSPSGGGGGAQEAEIDQTLVQDVGVGTKLGLIGPQMGQIWDFLRSVSVHFGARAKMHWNWSLKFPDLSHLGPNWPYLDAKFDVPALRMCNRNNVTVASDWLELEQIHTIGVKLMWGFVNATLWV